MNMLILNGGPGDGRGGIHRAIREIFEREGEACGLSLRAFDLAGLDVRPCRGCFACWLKHPGTCAIRDDQERILEAMASSAVSVWITPVTFGGYSSVLKKSLDRMIPNILPFFIRIHGEVHHPPRYNKGLRLIVLGTLPAGEEEQAEVFRGLAARNAINLHSTETRVDVVPEDVDESTLSGVIRKLCADMEMSK